MLLRAAQDGKRMRKKQATNRVCMFILALQAATFSHTAVDQTSKPPRGLYRSSVSSRAERASEQIKEEGLVAVHLGVCRSKCSFAYW